MAAGTQAPKTQPTKVLFILDKGDAHGLSLQFTATSLTREALSRGYQFVVEPVLLGELPAKLEEITNMPPFLKPKMVIIGDLPFTIDAEKSVEAIKKLSEQGVRVVIFDHHGDEKNVEALEQLKRVENVEVNLFASAYAMNNEFAKFIEETFDVRVPSFTKEVLEAGASADLDCVAIQVVGDEVKRLARLLDYLNGTFGNTVALVRLSAENLRELFEEMEQYDVVSKTLEKIKEIAEVKDGIAFLPYNTRLPALNKAIANYIAEGNARYVIVPVNSMNPRSKKYSTSLMAYASPCEDIMTPIKEALEKANMQAKVVGHPSFAITILRESDEPVSDEEARKLIEKTMNVIVNALKQ